MPTSFHIDLTKAIAQTVWVDQNSTSLDVLRLDRIHSIISGNKWFKLKYYLEEVVQKKLQGIITCGGAYSNHLVATAYACMLANIRSVGIIRGEEPANYSPTLRQLQEYGMQLHFVSRDEYKHKDALQNWATHHYPNLLWVDEGGKGNIGIKGAEEILSLASFSQYSHIICAVGTGTMMAGLINSSNLNQTIYGIPVLKIADKIHNELTDYLKLHCTHSNYSLLYDFHEGGYAKHNPALLQFMNKLFEQYQIPTDFVYTGKLFKAIFQLHENGYFPNRSKILVIHSGGLQGNRSLSKEDLVF